LHNISIKNDKSFLKNYSLIKSVIARERGSGACSTVAMVVIRVVRAIQAKLGIPDRHYVTNESKAKELGNGQWAVQDHRIPTSA